MENKEWWGEEDKKEQVSDFYKMKIGENKVRVLTQFERVDSVFQGEYPNSKFVGHVEEDYKLKGGEKVSTQGWAWGIDRTTGEMKIMQFSKAILGLINKLKSDEEYTFDNFPMPYDITIHNTGEGPSRYSITASRKNTDVTEDEVAELEKKTSIRDIISKIKEKKADVPPEVATPEKIYPAGPNPDDIPF